MAQHGPSGPVAWGSDAAAGENRPAWLRPTEPEQRWAVSATVTVAIVAQLAVSDRYVLLPRFVMPAIELSLVFLLLALSPNTAVGGSRAVRALGLVIIGLLAAANGASLVILIHDLLTAKNLPASVLLASGGVIWLTNVVVFAMFYWDFDRGGPKRRATGTDTTPDFLFPQMTDQRLARDWEPEFLDYLYVSFTNATAFSPTDAMPLSRWTKLMMLVQASVSLVTVALVAARAVNILPNG